MLSNLRLVDLRLPTAQQRSTGQNLPSDLYTFRMVSETLYEKILNLLIVKKQ
jgi:hypothetical protein